MSQKEIKAGMIEGMKLKQSFIQNEIQDGDIICYQVELPEKEYVYHHGIFVYGKSSRRDRIADLEAQSLYSSVPQFYDFLQNRILVHFKPRYEDRAASVPEFDLMLSKKMTYDIVSLISNIFFCVTMTKFILDGASSWGVPETRPFEVEIHLGS